jgi:hypothetical protein
LLNPKPPDPEAAFAFPAIRLPAAIPEKTAEEIEPLPNLEALLMSSRSMPAITRTAAAAFDFDVVSDDAPRPSRKPDPAPETARAEPGTAREKAKVEES